MDLLRAFYSIIAGVTGSAGMVLILADGEWGAPPTMRQAFGCSLFILSIAATLMLPLIGHRSDVNEAFRHGFDAGYRKAERAGRGPRVVKLEPRRRA